MKHLAPFMSKFHRYLPRLAVSVIVFYLIAVPLLGILIIASQRHQLANQQALLLQTKALVTQVKDGSERRDAEVQQINNHLDCIVAFFTEANRTDKTISDIDSCIVKSDAPQTSNVSASPQTRSRSAPSPVSSQTPAPAPERTSGSAETQPAPAPQPDLLQQLLNGLGI